MTLLTGKDHSNSKYEGKTIEIFYKRALTLFFACFPNRGQAKQAWEQALGSDINLEIIIMGVMPDRPCNVKKLVDLKGIFL